MYSIVIPCYNSSKSIAEVVSSIDGLMKEHGEDNYEIVMVDDCSPDSTWEELVRLQKEDSRRVCLKLARNFGQHAALMAGFNVVHGDIIVTVDDDGQTPVEQIWSMRAELDTGYDVVCAKYQEDENASFIRHAGTSANRLMRKWLLELPEGLRLSVFMMARRFVIDEIVNYTNPYPYLSGLVYRTTHNIGNVEMEKKKRAHGHSGYKFSKLLSLWLDGFSAFSLKPLRIASVLGMVCFAIGLVYCVALIVMGIANSGSVSAWAPLMAVMLLFCGAILLALGLLGEYVGRIYLCINASPQFVVRERLDSRPTSFVDGIDPIDDSNVNAR